MTPHLRLSRVIELRPEGLRALGISGLLLDVDNTLKDHGADSIDDEVVEWLGGLLAADVRLCLLSNGRAARIGILAGRLGVPFVARAFKPLPFGCRAGLSKLGLRGDQVAMVGDQVFADVLAGRLAGLRTILVPPTSPEEPWFTRIKRPFERLVLGRFVEAAWAVDGPPPAAIPPQSARP